MRLAGIFAVLVVGLLMASFFCKASPTPMSPIPAPTENGIGILEVGVTGQAGDNIITIHYLDSNGNRVHGEAQTGLFGTQNTQDDIPKGMSAADKAQRIVNAINDDPDFTNKIHATRTGHVVTIEAIGGCRGVTKVSMTDNTRERDKARVSYPPPPELAMLASLPSVDPEIARVIMIGGIQGTDQDDNDAVVCIGTDQWEGTWTTKNYATLPALIQQIVSDLVSHSIQASLENEYSIRIALQPADGGIIFGNTDVAIHILGSSGSEAP